MKDLVHTFFGWKPLCYWLGFTTFALGSLPTLAAPSSPGVGKEWVIVFEDDFDGDTIDVTKWVVRNESRGNGNNGVSWRWDTSNVSLSNGYLVIRTTHNNTTDVYSSGGIATEGIFQQRYGYFEARVDPPPPNNGHQAAFWMMPPGGIGNVNGNGRDGAEIDIVETHQKSSHYHGGLIWDGYGDDKKTSGPQDLYAWNIHSGYNTFGLYWDRDTALFYYNDNLKMAYEGAGVPRVAEHLIASVGIIKAVDGDIRQASLPQYTRFDYVRAWNKQNREDVELVDDQSGRIRYSGSWVGQGDALDYQGTMKQANTTGESAELDFVGSGIDVFARFGTYGGYVDVFLDGTRVAHNVETYRVGKEYQALLWSGSGLSPGPHTIRVELAAGTHPDASGSLLILDAFQITSTTISLADDDSPGTASFKAGLNWSNRESPRSGLDYHVVGHTLRTPDADTNDHHFAGKSLTIKGGNLTYQGQGDNLITVADLRLDNGSLRHEGDVGVLTFSGSVTLEPGGGTIHVDHADKHLSLAAPIGGTGTLRKIGQGSLSLIGATTFQGGTRIEQGILQSAQLAGSLVNVAGVFSPGLSPASTEVSGDYTQQAGGTIEVELGGVVAGTEYDRVSIGGAATLDGTLDIQLVNSFVPQAGDRFVVVQAASISGSFSITNTPALPAGLSWLIREEPDRVELRIASATDTDGDALEDAWELTHFPNLDTSDGGAQDSDADEFPDIFEQLAGTNPDDPDSRLKVEDIIPQGANDVDVEWQSVSGKFYRVQQNTGEPAGGWQTQQSGIRATGSVHRVRLTDPGERAWLRIELE